MVASGLESIALAVAHLERERSITEAPESSGPPDKLTEGAQHSPNPSDNNRVTERDHLITRRPSECSPSPTTYHRYAAYPPITPFGQQTPRLVSVDNLNHGEIHQSGENRQTMYPENGVTSHHVSPHRIHHENLMNHRYHHHFNYPILHQQNSGPPPRQLHQDLLYRVPAQHHTQQPIVMAQVQHPPPHHHHTSHPLALHRYEHMHGHHHQSPVLPETPSAKVAQPQPADIQPNPNRQSVVSSPSPSLSLPAAVLAFADNLEDFLTMEIDHTAYPPIPKSSEVIVQVQRNDVLLGRGGETNHHVGNIQYRQLVKICQSAYLEAKRRDKPKIAERIVHTVRMLSGRFLKKDADTSTWRDVGNTRAREKTSQALREGAPELRNGNPTTPSSPSDFGEGKRCSSQISDVQQTMDATSFIGSGTPPFFKDLSDRSICNGHPIAAFSGANLYRPPVSSAVVSPVDVVQDFSSPLKKAKLVNDVSPRLTVSNNESFPVDREVKTSAISVSVTVSGDDEESSSMQRISDDDGSSKSELKVEKRALPRVKLLKKRVEHTG